MGHKIIAGCMCMMLLASGCSTKGDKDENNSQGQAIDSSVVGIDTNEADVRRDIELSDPNKQALPGNTKDSIKSDEHKE